MGESGLPFDADFHRSRKNGEQGVVDIYAGGYMADLMRLKSGHVTERQLSLRYGRERYRLEHGNNVDQLTGAFNWVYSEKYLEAKIQAKQPFPLAFVDLDDFGLINKDYAHEVGNQVLVNFCHIADEFLESDALLGRYGGEEFVIAMPGTAYPLAVERITELGYRVRKGLRSLIPIHNMREVTMSAGIVQCEPGISKEYLINRANGLEKAAKKLGKNRLVYLNDGREDVRVFGGSGVA